MINLLRAEVYKVSGYKAFRRLFIGYFLVVFLASYLGDSLIKDFVQVAPGQNAAAFTAIDYWNALLWLGSTFHLYLAILLIMLISNEWETNTLRQQIIIGLAQHQIIFAKIFTASIFLILPVFWVFVLGLWFGSVSAEQNYIEVLPKFIGFYFNGFGVLAFGAAVAYWIKKPAAGILILLGYRFVFEPVLGVILEKKIPGSSIYLPFEVFNQMNEVLAESIVSFQLFVCIFYITSLWALCYWRIKHYDV